MPTQKRPQQTAKANSRRAFLFAVVVLTVAARPLPGVSKGTFQTQILAQAAPIRLDACQARSRDTEVGNQDFYFEVGVQFTNTGTKDVRAVRFKFTVSNTFGEQVESTYLSQEGTFSPGVLIDRMGWYSALNTYGVSSGTVYCSVDTVAFSDNTAWSSDTGGTPSALTPQSTSSDDHLWLGVGSAVNPFVHSHPKFCTIKEQVAAWNTDTCHYARIVWATRKSASQPVRQDTPIPLPTFRPQPGDPKAPRPMLPDADYSREMRDGHPAYCHADALDWYPWTHIKCHNYRIEYYREKHLLDPFDETD